MWMEPLNRITTEILSCPGSQVARQKKKKVICSDNLRMYICYCNKNSSWPVNCKVTVVSRRRK